MIALRPYTDPLTLCVEIALSGMEVLLLVFAMIQRSGLVLSTPASLVAMVVLLVEVRARCDPEAEEP